MTFDDDFIRLKFPDKTHRNILCATVGLDWPPPALLQVEDGRLFSRVGHSQLSDEERRGMKNVCRGALYFQIDRVKPPEIKQITLPPVETDVPDLSQPRN